MAKILISCTQYPYYGGAATNSYALIKYLRKHNHKVLGVFFENSNANVDPDKIGGVYKCNNKNNNEIKKKIINEFNSLPDIILAKNYAAPTYMKNMFPNVKVVYLVTGSPQMMELSKKGISAKKYIKSNNVAKFDREKECIKKADIVVPNSKIARQLLIKNYGDIPKIINPIDTSIALNNPPRNIIDFNRRKYDIGIVCSNLDRSVKNSKFAVQLYGNSFLKGKKKMVIGKNGEIFKKLNGVAHLGYLDNKSVISHISNTKLIICPSFYDASPNIIKEAILCGSNILVSKNCGWSETYSKHSVCEDVYSIKEWVSKINYLTKYQVKNDFKNDDLIKLINKII